MAYHIEAPKEFEKLLSKIPRADLIKIRNRIRSLAEDPRPPGMEKLYNNLYRVRQGNYRILYQIFDDRLVVLSVTVDHRRQVYRKL